MKKMVTVILKFHHTIFAVLLRFLKMRQHKREVSYASSFIFHGDYVVIGQFKREVENRICFNRNIKIGLHLRFFLDDAG